MKLLDWFKPKKVGEQKEKDKPHPKVKQTDFAKQTAWISPQWKLQKKNNGFMERRYLNNRIPRGWKKLPVKAQESLWKMKSEKARQKLLPKKRRQAALVNAILKEVWS